MELPALTDVRGIGVDTARLLSEHGFGDASALATASIEEIAAVPGFGLSRAGTVKRAAAALLVDAEAQSGGDAAPSASGESDSKAPAKKAKKKDKKKDKKKGKDKKKKKSGKGKKK